MEQNSKSPENPDESHVVESSVHAQSSAVILMSHHVTSQPDEPLKTKLINWHHETIVVTADSDPMRTDATGGLSEGSTEELSEETISISEQTEVTEEDIASQDIQPNEDSTS